MTAMILDREPMLVRPDRSRPPADVIPDPEAEHGFASVRRRLAPDISEIPVFLAGADGGDGKRVEIYVNGDRLGALTISDSADFLAILAAAEADGKPVAGVAIRDRDASGGWALRVYRPEPS